MKVGVSEDQIAAWKRELLQLPAAERLAQLHIWLGEYEFDHNEKPELALWHYRQAAHLCNVGHPFYGLALYDTAVTHYYQGAYKDAAMEFRHLLAARPAGVGYDFRNCALLAQHAAACWGYHEAHSRLEIPEPDQADPNCGAAALAACLRSLSMPSDRKTVLRYCRVTGLGSSWQDIRTAGKRMGLQVRGVSADDAGLIALPKPLIAFVEHDHFIAVTGASRAGMTYLCSDCGPWPGGRVFVSWKAYHALNASAYGVVVRKGSLQDQRLQSLLSSKRPVVRVASAGPLKALLHILPAAMRVMQASLIGSCGPGPRPSSPEPPCFVCMQGDHSGGGSAGGASGDPVDLGTLEEEYHPPTDLTVYNPVGPSVTWERIYNSLRTGVSDFGD